MSEINLLEDGEIESESDDFLNVYKSTQPASKSIDLVKNKRRTIENFQKNEHRPKGSRCCKRRRRCESRDRNASYEKPKSNKMDPVEIAELDEYEMLCIRGASPETSATEPFLRILDETNPPKYYEYSERNYRFDSDESYTKRRSPPKRRRERSRRRQRRNRRQQSPEKKSITKSLSADEQDYNCNDRKMEICKFYLLDCCVKRTICKYMHSEFPCKYFYLGLDCGHEKPCKFSHGKPLSEEMTQALARHIAAAPKAILGNFKRLSRDKALSLIEAKNRQLSSGEGYSEKKCATIEQAKSSKTTGEQDFSGIFSLKQIEKITALGITNFEQINQMSLAQLSDIGLSIRQIGEIQRTVNSELSIMKPTTCSAECETDQAKDMDMRQFLLLPIPTNDVKNYANSCLSENDEAKIETNLGTADLEMSRAKSNQGSNSLSIPYNLLDDESELIIDETADELEMTNLLTNEKSSESETQIESAEISYPDLVYDKVSISSTDSDIFYDVNFDEPYEPASFYAEPNESDFETSNAKTTNNEPVLSDYDMRLPFTSVIENYVPAMELDGSLKSHTGIPYKLIEIVVEDKTSIHSNLIQNISPNTLDPRLKKLLKPKKKNPEDLQLDDSFLSKLNKTDSVELSLDPRKRKEQTIESTTPKPTVQNCSYVLNSYLQKSKWYQNLNSKNKIEINQHLAELTCELNRFTQNPTSDRQFLVSSLQNGRKIQEILHEIDLEVSFDGSIQEIIAAPIIDPLNSLNTEMPFEIPSLLSMNLNQNPINYQPNTAPVQLAMPIVPHYKFPKPGLLGIAPGIEMPQFFNPANNVANFHGAIQPTNWNHCMQAFLIQNNIATNPNDSNRNQFHLKMGKRWNRKGNNKRI